MLTIALLWGCQPTPAPSDPPSSLPSWSTDPERRVPDAVRQSACMDVEIADVDANGTLDVVLALEGPANAVLLNDGAGRLTVMETAFRSPSDAEHVQVADIDGDGRVDLYFANEDLGGADELYLGGVDGFVDASDSLLAPAPTNAAVLRDLDGDGAIDLLRGNAGQNTWWRYADGAWQDLTDGLPEDTSVTQDLEAGDLDGDGDLDLVLGNEGEDEVWLQTDHGFERGESLPFGGGETREVGLGDVDQDGDLDLVLARVGWTGRPAQSRLLMSTGDGEFEHLRDGLPEEQLDTLDLDFVDLDGDGDPDLIGAHASHAQGQLQPEAYTVWENRAGRYVDVTATVLPGRPRGIGLDVEAADLDGDGVLDLYLCGRGTADRVLFGAL